MKISSPTFQKLAALDKFEFHKLHDVVCNICGKQADSDVLFKEGPFEIIKCRCCGLLYVSPQPEEKELRLFYKHFFSHQEKQSSKRWKNVNSFKQAAHLLAKYLPEEQRNSFLEIGSGYGFFLSYLKVLGFKKMSAIEPDSAIVKASQLNYEGIEVFNNTFNNVDLGQRDFSAIMMLASLEHFLDPLAVLEKCHKHLKKDGVIIIRVPYLEGFFKLNKLLKKKIVGFGAPRHLYDYSPKTLTQLLKEAGFEWVEIHPGAGETSSNSFFAFLTFFVKKITRLIWVLSGKKYLNPYSGSIVAVSGKSNRK